MPNNENFTLSELATYLGRSERTLNRWHAHRKGPPRFKIGNLVLFRRAAVEAWITGHEVLPLDIGGRGHG